MCRPAGVVEPALSGDEADMDGEGRVGRRRLPRANVRSKDFEASNAEPDNLAEQKKKHRKRHKHNQHRKRSLPDKSGTQRADAIEKGPEAISAVREPSTLQAQDRSSAPKIVVLDAESVPASSPKRPFNMRQLTEAVHQAGFNSTVFPHHAATGRPLAMPLQNLRAPSQPRQSSTESIRRTSSMPDMMHRTISNTRPVLAHGTSSAGAQPQSGDAPPETSPQDVQEEKHNLSKTSAIVTLLCITGLVALCAEFLVGSLDYLISTSGVSQAFIGLIILPIVGNAAEHVTAVTVAAKNKMDLAIGIALGSSIQIAIFVTPLMVILGWIINREMSLYFSLFETVALFATALIVSFLLIDGRSNYLEGSLLIAAYIIIAVSAFFYPSCDLSAVSGAQQNAAGCPSPG